LGLRASRAGHDDRRGLDRFRRHALQKRLERAVVDAPTVVLGTTAIPFEALDDRHALLDSLEGRDGVAITLITRGAVDDEDEIQRLARLDLDHAVTVDIHLDATLAPSRFAALRSIERFAALGIATRLILDTISDADVTQGALGAMVDEAAALGVVDVVVRDDGDASAEPANRRAQVELYRLRLRHDLPRALPGRG
ncbi:MAG: hypothetical protein AAGE94_20320, partial [Acidobacteriota bacterium]